jgi:flagellar biosynthesis protein FliQ
MTDTMILQIGLMAMIAAAKLAAPILLTSLTVGLSVGMLQSVTQIQEATLTFVPKFIAVGTVMMVSGSWMLRELVSFTEALYQLIPTLVNS